MYTGWYIDDVYIAGMETEPTDPPADEETNLT